MAIEIAWQVRERPLCERAVARAVEAALEHGGRGGLSLSVVFVDDPTLAELHGRYLGDPSPTDVIGFDLGLEGGELEGACAPGPAELGPAGELYVSVDRAREVAAARGVGVDRELALYLVHGTLHLCGYDDLEEEDRARMRAAEQVVMASLGYPEDPLPHDLDS